MQVEETVRQMEAISRSTGEVDRLLAQHDIAGARDLVKLAGRFGEALVTASARAPDRASHQADRASRRLDQIGGRLHHPSDLEIAPETPH